MRIAMARIALVAATLVPVAAAGQVGAAAGRVGAVQDSAAALEAARAAQARFERDRRTRLPWTLAGTGGVCGEVVGRFCWRPEDGEGEAPPEPDAIGSARLGLLIELAGLSTHIPGDRWVLGQRVRYRIEAAQVEAERGRAARQGGRAGALAAAAADSGAAEHLAAAEALARSCRNGRADGWCQDLVGLALHAQGRFADAQAAFAAAREAAVAAAGGDGGRGDAGRDLRDVLDADARRLLGEAEDTAAFLRTLWLLADPFWALPANDRRTEHEARRVMGRLQEDARNTFGIPWGDDLRELHVRFGWEVAWARTRRSSGAMTSAGTAVIGHQQDDGYGFVPEGALLTDPLSAPPRDWTPAERPRREGYSPPYLDTLGDAEHQLAAFRRGDSLLILAAVRRPAAEAPGPASWMAPEPFDAVVFVPWPEPGPPAGQGVDGLIVAPSGDDGIEVGSEDGVARTRAILPAGAYLVSVESLGPAGSGARARYGFRRDTLAEGVADLSDLLLFEPEAGAGAELDRVAARGADLGAAIRRMLPGGAVRAGESLGVAWEVYGLRSEGERVEFDVSLVRRDESFLRRAGRWLRLVGDAGDVSVRWSDAALPTDGVYARTLIVDTPPDLASGRYSLRVVARLDGRADLAGEREVLVRRGGG